MARRVFSTSLVLALTLLSGCGLFSRGARPGPGEAQEGVASWYGPGFHGKRTASGSVYNQNDMTAAHQTLPLGTRVFVTNLRNGRRVEVEVTDRGPFVDDRIIDLSYAAARALDMVGPGTAPVRIEPASDQPLVDTLYAVQVGAFRDSATAGDVREQLEEEFDDVHVTEITTAKGTFHRVRVGRFEDRAEAQDLAGEVAAQGWAAVVVEDSGGE